MKNKIIWKEPKAAGYYSGTIEKPNFMLHLLLGVGLVIFYWVIGRPKSDMTFTGQIITAASLFLGAGIILPWIYTIPASNVVLTKDGFRINRMGATFPFIGFYSYTWKLDQIKTIKIQTIRPAQEPIYVMIFNDGENDIGLIGLDKNDRMEEVKTLLRESGANIEYRTA